MEYRIATKEEVAKQFDYLISIHEDKALWTKFKNGHLRELDENKAIPYYGFIGDDCICEAYAIKNEDNPNRVYLKAFRTRKEYQNQGNFSGLFHFMINDLRKRGYTEATVGVESTDTVNKSRYSHYDFKTHIDTLPETYSDGSIHEVEYYLKELI